MSRDPDDPELKTRLETDEDLEDLALEEDYALNPDYVREVDDALDRGDAERLRELLAALRSEDIADLMGFLSAGDREELVSHIDPEILGEVLVELDDEIREGILEHVPAAMLAKALGDMDSDDAADVVDDLEADQRAQVLAAMPEVERAAIETTLAYEEETAGRCAAILSNGKRCPNASIPGSRYCGLPAHQALTDTDNDFVTGEPPAADVDVVEEAPVDG